MFIRIVGIVNYENASQTITVLCGKMTVVPESAYIIVVNIHCHRARHSKYPPGWSGTLKSYKNEFPVAIGHCVTMAGPSAQLVPSWNNPCQCYQFETSVSGV